MTVRTLKVNMDTIMAEAICAYVDEQMNHNPSEERARLLQEADDVATKVLRATNLMNAATTLYEDDRVVLMEHPAFGDEHPIMAYFKEDQAFEENTGMWDVDDVEEIIENYRAAGRKF